MDIKSHCGEKKATDIMNDSTLPVTVKSGPNSKSVEIRGFVSKSVVVKHTNNKITYQLDMEAEGDDDNFNLQINPKNTTLHQSNTQWLEV